ncbi:hypothetical protein ACQZV8_15845 [Magnetococcales bacterium HHB-1]
MYQIKDNILTVLVVTIGHKKKRRLKTSPIIIENQRKCQSITSFSPLQKRQEQLLLL